MNLMVAEVSFRAILDLNRAIGLAKKVPIVGKLRNHNRAIFKREDIASGIAIWSRDYRNVGFPTSPIERCG
jgi:hypothetical protein